MLDMEDVVKTAVSVTNPLSLPPPPPSAYPSPCSPWISLSPSSVRYLSIGIYFFEKRLEYIVRQNMQCTVTITN